MADQIAMVRALSRANAGWPRGDQNILQIERHSRTINSGADPDRPGPGNGGRATSTGPRSRLRPSSRGGEGQQRAQALTPPRQVTARLLLMAGILVAFSVAWRQFRTIPLLVIGQPRMVGLLQREQEAPFFRRLAASTGLPLQITYRTSDAFGLKDTHQLEALSENRIDIVSLRFMQNMDREPSLEGIDLPGMIPDFAVARRVADAYIPMVDRYLQQSFRAKLLAIWSFGPQVMTCRTKLTDLNDLRGRRVRVASPGLAQLMGALGAIPAVLPFEDTKRALANGIVDCAVTSAASSSFAGWTRYTNYLYPLAFQFGFNGYAISLRKWNSLSTDEQARLEKAFKDFEASLWTFSQNLQRRSEACLLGAPCEGLQRQKLILVQPTREDARLLQNLSRRVVLPSWSDRCEQKHPGCRREWERLVAPLTDFSSSQQRQP